MRSLVKSGVTLIELLVVLAIIAALMGIVLPAVQSARSAARRIACQNTIRQLGIGLQSHESTYGCFPAGTSTRRNREFQSWCVRVLPYVEQVVQFDQSEAAFNSGWDAFDPTRHPLLQTPNPAFACTEDYRVGESAVARHSSVLVGLTSFLGCNGLDYESSNGILFADSKVRAADVTDGLSNTILVAERPPSVNNDLGWWYAGVGTYGSTTNSRKSIGVLDHTLGAKEKALSPYSQCDPSLNFHHFPTDLGSECNASFFWSYHAGGSNFLFADGSVRFVGYGSATLEKLSTKSLGEVVME